MTQMNPDALGEGLIGTITLGIDPGTVNDGSGGGTGGSGGGPLPRD